MLVSTVHQSESANMYTYIPLPREPPSHSTPILPSSSSQSTEPSFCAIQQLPTMCVCALNQSYPTLFDPMDYSLPGSIVRGIFQARTLEWVAISFSNAWKWKVKVKSLSRVWLLVTPWTAAYQSPSMGVSRQEYWSGLPLPSPSLALVFYKMYYH